MSAMVAPLKKYALDTLRGMSRAVEHYQNLDTSTEELELLKILLFTNIDSLTENNLGQPEQLSDIREEAKCHLLAVCEAQYGPVSGRRRYDQLLMSLTLIKDLSVRLESCMIQQSEVASTLNAILATIPVHSALR